MVSNLDNLRVREVAARLGCSRATVWNLINAKKFPGAFRLGGDSGDWRVPAADVDACIEANRQAANTIKPPEPAQPAEQGGGA